MANNGVPNPNFKEFMANSAQANWDVVQIVYGSKDASDPSIYKLKWTNFVYILESLKVVFILYSLQANFFLNTHFFQKLMTHDYLF
jgi:hypothetical protein